MGCGSSAAENAARLRQRPNKPDGRVSNPISTISRSDSVNSINFYFSAITAGAKMIAAPSNMMPIVCLSKESFPVVTSFLHLDDSTPTEIQLPIVASAFSGHGRVVCFSQIQFLSPRSLQISDTTRLITNAIQWISEGKSSMTPIYALGFNPQIQPLVIAAAQELGFFLEMGGFRPSYSSYKAVLLPSDIEFADSQQIDGLLSYVQNQGGGIAAFYNHTDISAMAIPINRLLIHFNLSFTYCLLNEDIETADSIQVPVNYNHIRENNFVPLLLRFKSLVKQNFVDTSSLDDLVTTLRYYIMVCDNGFSDQLIEMTQYSWEYLNRTNYHTADGGICPDLTHGIIAVLLIDLYTKLPYSFVKPIPEADILPGKTGEVVLGQYDFTLQLQKETWVSTGLWLPAGVIGEVICENLKPNIHIQVGSHHESLVTKQAPWKRWPLIVSVALMSKPSTSIASPFGGIVYIAVNDFGEAGEMKLTFKNFCKHPMVKWDDGKIWEETKDVDVPWGEIVAENVIFTVPSKIMRTITDYKKIFDTFGVIVKEISGYLTYNVDRPYRFVFDIELPDENPSCGYPLVFLIQDIEGILCHLESPTPQLFSAVTLMAIVSIRENCFDSITETAIATIVTSVIFKKLYPGFDPLEFEGISLPTLFHELWEIHSRYDSTLIPRTLAKYQDPSCPVPDVPEDMWICFVREMCHIGNKDFTKLLERSRPIPLNISTSLQGLAPYFAGEASSALK